MTSKTLNTYISQVEKALGNHPEKDDILQELNAHIWDYANNLSRNSGCSVEDAFSMAIASMEDPQVLARSFQYEYPEHKTGWKQPQSLIPEKKVADRDFMVIGIIAFLAATIVLSVISWASDITGLNLGIVNFFVGLIQFGILIALILGLLYYRNEQEFQDQLTKLKFKFEKFENDKEVEKRVMKAAEQHIEGLFEVIFGVAGIALMIYVTFIAKWEVFNSLWYSYGFVLSLFLSILELLMGMMKMFVGRIRISRILNAGKQSFGAVVNLIYLIFFPFNLERGLAAVEHPTGLTIVNFINSITSYPDYHLRIFLGIVVVFYIMDAVYNVVKFGTWHPSHQISLTIKSEEEK